jgi:hypothetical protein
VVGGGADRTDDSPLLPHRLQWHPEVNMAPGKGATPPERREPDQADSGANRAVSGARRETRGHRSAAHALRAPGPTSDPASTGALFDCGNWRTFRLRLTLLQNSEKRYKKLGLNATWRPHVSRLRDRLPSFAGASFSHPSATTAGSRQHRQHFGARAEMNGASLQPPFSALAAPLAGLQVF